jgi:DNA-binding beta-propeller fold protein YncE
MKRQVGGYIVLIICGLLYVGCDDKIDPHVVGLFPPLGAAFSVAGGEVTFFDLTTGEIKDTREMNGYTISASFALSGNAVYLTNNDADNVAIYELPEFEPAVSLPNGGVPLDLCINRAATVVYLINANGNLRRYNQVDEGIDTVAVGMNPRRLTLTPVEERNLWVACRGDSSVHIVDLNSFSCSDRLKFDQQPSDIRFSPDGNLAYVALQGFGGIHVIDAHTLAEIEVLQAGPGPMDLAIDHEGRLLVASDSTLGRVKVWDLLDHQDWSLNVGGSDIDG